MTKIVYPKGSIITKKDDEKKYCITNIEPDGYEATLYPIGIQKANEYYHIKYDEVESLFFWGYMDENYKKEILALYPLEGDKKDVS